MDIHTDFWNHIILPSRLGAPVSKSTGEYRSVFDMDHDRIMYSNFFRRMHDKTQVFPYAPLSSSGQARSRLSHSLEVSCVARSLGMLIGRYLVSQGISVEPHDVGMVCASACLAHDIGNPPFGHSGEYAIQHWCTMNLNSVILDQWERSDFISYEGNAQGFRILSRLETWQRAGGLRPTVATLCAFTKYPCSSQSTRRQDIPGSRKHGYFKADLEAFREVFSATQLVPLDKGGHQYPRHPLAFITEAADDICYAVVDLEDAYHLGLITFEQVYAFLMPIAECDSTFTDEPYFDNEIRIARLRSATISTLINQAFTVFTGSITSFEDMSFRSSIMNRIQSAQAYRDICDFSRVHIYNSSRVLEIECAGFKTIGGLLDMFVPAVLSDAPSSQDAVFRKIIPARFYKRHEQENSNLSCDELISQLSPYERILSVTDFISGMTDRYAVELFQRLSGIKLPVY